MNVVILTSHRRGLASRVVPVLCRNPNLTVTKVILSHGGAPNRKKLAVRKLKKTLRIGILGAINGIRMRSWFEDDEAEDIVSVCESLNVHFSQTQTLNSDPTKELMRGANAELGLSLGNGYIAKSVFSIPKYGMLNNHSEILPRFQGALSVVWPIYEGVQETGFTIHQIDSSIDTGEILYQEKHPIQFHSKLQDTVEHSIAEVRLHIPEAFSQVCENYVALKQCSLIQQRGQTYTTPTLREYLRMKRNNRAMHRDAMSSDRG